MKRFVSYVLAFLISAVGLASADVVINEIHYNPTDRDSDAGSFREFVELYNPGPGAADLSRYTFTKGITYSFPADTALAAGEYLVVARVPTHRKWRNRPYAIYGPYTGKLSNSGERLTLERPNGTTADRVKYDDSAPWPRGADGYGPSLERIAWDLDSDDDHSWRASRSDDGTPGNVNSAAGTVPRPVMIGFGVLPAHPTSQDSVTIQIGLDTPELIASAELVWERVGGVGARLAMDKIAEGPRSATYAVTIPPAPSQSLIRFNTELRLTSGARLRLPDTADPRPFESYFVYDGEIDTGLPLLWVFDPVRTNLPDPSRNIGGAVTLPLGSAFPEVYDGVSITRSRNGHKIKFLKGEEYQGNRTLNIIPESPPEGTTAGPQSPHCEQISYRIFRDFGVLAPQSDWYRVIEDGGHTQRVAIQQPNERFLEMNGRDSDGNLYKIAYNEPGGYSKKTNLDEGDEDYRELFQHVTENNRTDLAEQIRQRLVFEEIMGYNVATMLLSHWDGIKNNIFLYHDPEPDGRWEIIPWDLDKTFGYTDSDPMFWKMPIDFFRDLDAPGSGELVSRNLRGPITMPFASVPEFHEEFIVRVVQALDGLFSLERIGGMIDETESLLVDDLARLEAYTGRTRSSRRNQIETSSETMRFFLRNRHGFLRTQIPTSFIITRTLPSRTYHAGSAITGIELTVSVIDNTTINAEIVERIPEGFTASNARVTAGDFTLSGSAIVWRLPSLSDQAQLTYDLTAPVSDPPLSATIEGTISEGGTEYPTEATDLRHSSDIGPDWVIGAAGRWVVANGVLSCYAESGHDPKHAWVDRDFGTGDYTVRADVRMLDWQDHDLARSGIAVRVNPDDGERALNLLLHENDGSVDLLNDLVAWGTRGDYGWQIGEWYTMILGAEGSLLEGSIKKTGADEQPYTLDWDTPGIAQRSPGFPGLTGSTLLGLTVEFDNFEVIVDGEVVFSDDFEPDVGVTAWEVY